MNEYVTKFTQLCCNAPHEVDTDGMKQECFLNGLNDGLSYTLEHSRDGEQGSRVATRGKCWLCKHKCFRLCSRPWSTCKLLSLKHRHRRRGIGLEIFSTLSRLPFPMLWSQWMLIIGSSLLRRSCKWCSATIMRRCY
jgi:hypothetical protein